MGIIKKLIARFWPAGALFLIGFLLIIYIAFGFVYSQQAPKQRELKGQITKLSLVVAKSLPSAEKLQAEYEKVNESLAPMTDKDAIAMLVGIADESGIAVDPDSGKFRVPSAARREEKMGGGSYQVLSFKNIYVQADYDNVMAFLSDLDSGKTRETMVLKRVATSQKEVKFVGEEGARRAEFRNVAAAVIAMMTANALSEIPVPVARASDGTAVNDMTAFPDVTTTAADKGADATFMTDAGATEVLGYLLYGHQLIVDVDGDGVYDTADGDDVKIVYYVTMETITYYYTCEADGTVRQFDGASVVTATEYLSSEESKIETVVIVDVDIYTKPEE